MSDKQLHGYMVSTINTGRTVVKSMSAPLMVKAEEVARAVATPAGYMQHDVSGLKVFKRVFNPAMLHLAVSANTYNARAIEAKVRSAISGGFNITGDPTDKDKARMIRELNELARRFDSDFLEFLTAIASDAEEYGTALPVLFSTDLHKPHVLDQIPGDAVYKLWTDEPTDPLAWVHKVDANKREIYRAFGSKDPVAGEKKNVEAMPLIRRSSLDRTYGAPAFIPAFQAIALATLIDEFNLSWFSNQAMPDYAVVIEGDPPTDFKENIDAYFHRAIKSKAGQTLVLEIPQGAKITFEKLTAEIKDASFKIQRKDSRDEIISAHGVPPLLMGIVETGALGGNVGQEQKSVFKTTLVDPLQKKLNRIGSRLLERVNGHDRYGMALVPFDAEDEKLNSETDQNDIESGAATINEVRQRRDRAAMDNALADLPKPLWPNPQQEPLDDGTVKALREVNAELKKYVVGGGAE